MDRNTIRWLKITIYAILILLFSVLWVWHCNIQKSSNKYSRYKATVRIETLFISGDTAHVAIGTGWFVGPNGQFITAAHVIPRGTVFFAVKRFGLPVTTRGIVLFRDTKNDVLLGQIPFRTPYYFLPCGKQSEPGTNVEYVGQGMGYDWSFGRGWIMGHKRKDDMGHDLLVQVGAPIVPGDSGSALVNSADGCVEGVITEALNVSSIGFAQPLSVLKNLLGHFRGLPL